MLVEEQAAELLRRCEVIARRKLTKLRGELRNAQGRAPAVWEMLVVDAAARLGRVEYEQPSGGPDVRLQMPTGRWVWIEVAYLLPRFSRQEHLSRVVAGWIRERAKTLGPDAPSIGCSFHGDPDHPAGPVRTLPQEHEREAFLASQEVASFFECVRANPTERLEIRLARYTLTLEAVPKGTGGRASYGGGLVQEVARTPQEHAVFRVLKKKRAQHEVPGPRLVCIGSDVSPALRSVSGGLFVSVEQAVGTHFHGTRSLSGALVVKVQKKINLLLDTGPEARGTAYANPNARDPLTTEEWNFLRQLDFNRWKVTFPMSQKEAPKSNRERNVLGPLSQAHTAQGTLRLTMPAPLVVDALAGRRALLDSYRGATERMPNDVVARCLSEGWAIVGCSFSEGDLERAEAASITLELAPPHDPVFWARGKA